MNKLFLLQGDSSDTTFSSLQPLGITSDESIAQRFVEENMGGYRSAYETFELNEANGIFETEFIRPLEFNP